MAIDRNRSRMWWRLLLFVYETRGWFKAEVVVFPAADVYSLKL